MSTAPAENPLSAPTPPRRSFLKKALAIVIAGVAILVPTVISAAYLLTPLIKRKRAAGGDSDFRFVGKIGGMTPGGSPKLFQVLGIKQDAWTTYPATSLGSVFIRMEANGTLICLNARCTHLGCKVGFQPANNCYLCPCHTASFTLEGERMNQVPPRNLDRLEAQIRNQDEVWVRYVDYRCGTDEQIPV